MSEAIGAMKRRCSAGGFNRLAASVLSVAMIALLANPASAANVLMSRSVPDWHTGPIPVAHGLDVVRVIRRFQGSVAAVGDPDENGDIYSFQTENAGFAAGEVQHWRLTFVSGERYAAAFQIRANAEDEITVFSLDGPLNGIAENDLFLVESVFSLRRYEGAVTALGEPNADGDVFSFSGNASGYASGELREWRVTFVGGQRFAAVFEISDNTDSEITVSPRDGPLNGISIGDRFFIENAPVRRTDDDTNAGGSAAPD